MRSPNSIKMLSKESQVTEEIKRFTEQAAPLGVCEQNLSLGQELEQLENLLSDGIKVPLTELMILDSEQLLAKLHSIKARLPMVFAHAQDILRNKHEIIQSAENYARNLVESAEDHAAQILSKSDLVRESELEASKIMFRVHKECEQIKQKTQADMEQLRAITIAECQEMQAGSDHYADAVLGNLEQEVSSILGVIRNGRQQLK